MFLRHHRVQAGHVVTLSYSSYIQHHQSNIRFVRVAAVFGVILCAAMKGIDTNGRVLCHVQHNGKTHHEKSVKNITISIWHVDLLKTFSSFVPRRLPTAKVVSDYNSNHAASIQFTFFNRFLQFLYFHNRSYYY